MLGSVAGFDCAEIAEPVRFSRAAVLSRPLLAEVSPPNAGHAFKGGIDLKITKIHHLAFAVPNDLVQCKANRQILLELGEIGFAAVTGLYFAIQPQKSEEAQQ